MTKKAFVLRLDIREQESLKKDVIVWKFKIAWLNTLDKMDFKKVFLNRIMEILPKIIKKNKVNSLQLFTLLHYKIKFKTTLRTQVKPHTCKKACIKMIKYNYTI